MPNSGRIMAVRGPPGWLVWHAAEALRLADDRHPWIRPHLRRDAGRQAIPHGQGGRRGAGGLADINIVVNWIEELKRSCPPTDSLTDGTRLDVASSRQDGDATSSPSVVAATAMRLS